MMALRNRSEDHHLTQSDRHKSERIFQSGSEKRKKSKKCAESIAKLPNLDAFMTGLPNSRPSENVLSSNLNRIELESSISHSSTPVEFDCERVKLEIQGNDNTENDIGKWS